MTAASEKLLSQQKLWFCSWGTMIVLTWAMSAENAEQRVRYQRFDRRLRLDEILRGPVLVTGEVRVRLATEKDKELYVEWGGEVPA